MDRFDVLKEPIKELGDVAATAFEIGIRDGETSKAKFRLESMFKPEFRPCYRAGYQLGVRRANVMKPEKKS